MRANTGGRRHAELHNAQCARCARRTHGTSLYRSQARNCRICPSCRGLEIIETVWHSRLSRHRSLDAETWWEDATREPSLRMRVQDASLEAHAP